MQGLSLKWIITILSIGNTCIILGVATLIIRSVGNSIIDSIESIELGILNKVSVCYIIYIIDIIDVVARIEHISCLVAI